MVMTIVPVPVSISDVCHDTCLGVSLDICDNRSKIMPNFCESNDRGIWTIIPKRFDCSVDLCRNWTEYKEGLAD